MRSASLIRRFAIPLCAAAVLACGVVPAQAATTLTPNIFGDPSGPGAGNLCTPTPTAGHCSLRGAIAAAQEGDTVQLAAGTYELKQGGELDLTKKIMIVGAGAGLTTIEQTEPERVMKVLSGLTMSGVTITGGEAIGAPGADGPTVGADGKEGEGVSGGGISASGGLVTLTDVVVSGNSVHGGGGGQGAIATGALSGGAGGRGGFADGAGISGGPLVLDRVAVTDNVAQPGQAGAGGDATGSGNGGKGGNAGTAAGAGIAAGSAALIATDTLIADNTAGGASAGAGGLGGTTSGTGGAGGAGEGANGGGIFANGPVALTNVTIAGNLTTGGIGGKGGAARGSSASAGGTGGYGQGGSGGAVALFNGVAAKFASVTIDDNTALPGTVGGSGAGKSGGAAGAAGTLIPTEGGDLFVTSSSLLLRGTIVAGGHADAGHEDCAIGGGGTVTSAGHNLEEHHQCIATAGPGDLLDKAPGLGPLAANGGPTETMALLPGSAAIDAGETACMSAAEAPLAEDQRGEPRGTPCDIGAFEVQPPPQPGGGGSGAGGESGGGSGPGGRSAGEGSPKGSPAVPHLTGLALSPASVRNGKKATIAFHLDVAARVTFTMWRKAPGVTVGKKCVAATKSKAGKRCDHLVGAAPAPPATNATAGADHLTWVPKNLKPGRYVLSATPAGGAAATRGFVLRAPSPR